MAASALHSFADRISKYVRSPSVGIVYVSGEDGRPCGWLSDFKFSLEHFLAMSVSEGCGRPWAFVSLGVSTSMG